MKKSRDFEVGGDSAQILRAVESLTEQGTAGFYASAIVAELDADSTSITAQLLTLVAEAKLSLKYDLRCPDNGRRICEFEKPEEIPFGTEIRSDKCESDAEFVVDGADIFLRFVATQSFAASLRRRARSDGERPPGKARPPRVPGGMFPQPFLP